MNKNDNEKKSSESIEKYVKDNTKFFKKIGKFVLTAIKTALRMIKKVLKTVLKVMLSLNATMVVLILLISTFGIVYVIQSGALDFVLQSELGTEDSSDPLNGLSPDDGDLYYMAVAGALDLEKIYSYWNNNTNGFKDWYNGQYNITSLQTECPSKMIELFMLNDEIYNRSEINGSSYDFIINKVCSLGCFMIESSQQVFSFGDSESLFDSPIGYHCNRSGYADPYGNDPRIWLTTGSLAGTTSMGCTFISRYENENIADEHRAIFGAMPAIKAGQAGYITESTLTRNSGMTIVGLNDDAGSYLNSKVLNNTISSSSYFTERNSTTRGFTTWIPDAMYNYAYTDRIYSSGHDRDTHNQSSKYYAGGNFNAVKELQTTYSLTKEQCGTIMDMLHGNDRIWHDPMDCIINQDDTASYMHNYTGEFASIMIIFYLEGVLDEIATTYNGRFGSSSYFPYTLAETLFGARSGSSITSLSDTAYYKKIYDMIDHGTTKNTYSQEFIDSFKLFNTNYNSAISSLLVGNGFTGQGLVHLVYGMTCYVAGTIMITGIRNLIHALYYYQEASSGKYIFRLKDISAELANTINSAASCEIDLLPVDPAYDDPSLISSSATIEYFCRFAVAIGEDNSHGYSQKRRIGGIDYDCSSLVNTALIASGINVYGCKLVNVPTTHYMYDKLMATGVFEDVTDQGSAYDKIPTGYKRGDVIIYGAPGFTHGHTEIYLGDGKDIGAHDDCDGVLGDSTATGKEINVSNFYDVWADHINKYGSNKFHVLRYIGGDTTPIKVGTSINGEAY